MGDVALEGLRQRSRPLKQSDMVPRIMAVSENEDHGIRDAEVFELKDRGQTSDMAGSAPVESHYSPVQAPIAETNLDVEDDLSCDDSRQLLSPDQNSDDASVIDDEVSTSYNISF
ncbi:hypothetical protein BgiBS90_017185 [Biomphalaria glabrata]|uniref:Uncharacterized protein n=1 Tax=Biomphalaria glabrata TaxID=6526 RepID=A0A2C9M9W3_BIOGL|nr:hypothetical protein BgiBS90_017185 [Biomphalaria glabrata]